MTAFLDLLRYSPATSPGERQADAARRLPACVANSRMQWWTPGDPIPASGRWLLIGVAVWTGHDLHMLDVVDAELSDPNYSGPAVAVFDTGLVLSMAEFEAILPGIGSVHHMPAVGLFINGRLVETECGFAGRQLVARALGIDESLIQPPARVTI